MSKGNMHRVGVPPIWGNDIPVRGLVSAKFLRQRVWLVLEKSQGASVDCHIALRKVHHQMRKLAPRGDPEFPKACVVARMRQAASSSSSCPVQ